MDVRQAVAAVKRVVSDARYAGGDRYAGEACAEAESKVTDARYSVGDRYVRQGGQIIECVVPDGSDAGSDLRRLDPVLFDAPGRGRQVVVDIVIVAVVPHRTRALDPQDPVAVQRPGEAVAAFAGEPVSFDRHAHRVRLHAGAVKIRDDAVDLPPGVGCRQLRAVSGTRHAGPFEAARAGVFDVPGIDVRLRAALRFHGEGRRASRRTCVVRRLSGDGQRRRRGLHGHSHGIRYDVVVVYVCHDAEHHLPGVFLRQRFRISFPRHVRQLKGAASGAQDLPHIAERPVSHRFHGEGRRASHRTRVVRRLGDDPQAGGRGVDGHGHRSRLYAVARGVLDDTVELPPGVHFRQRVRIGRPGHAGAHERAAPRVSDVPEIADKADPHRLHGEGRRAARGAHVVFRLVEDAEARGIEMDRAVKEILGPSLDGSPLLRASGVIRVVQPVAVGEGVILERRDAERNGQVVDSRRIVKGPGPDGRHAGGDAVGFLLDGRDPDQLRPALVEKDAVAIGKRGVILRHVEGGQAAAAGKGHFPDRRDAGGDVDAREIHAQIKGVVPEGGHALGDLINPVRRFGTTDQLPPVLGEKDAVRAVFEAGVGFVHDVGGHGVAADERMVADLADAGRDHNGGQAGAGTEGIVRDGLHTRGDRADAAGSLGTEDQGFPILAEKETVRAAVNEVAPVHKKAGEIIAAVEGVDLDHGDACGDGERLQSGAALKRDRTDGNQTVRQRYGDKAAAVFEGPFTDAGHALGHHQRDDAVLYVFPGTVGVIVEIVPHISCPADRQRPARVQDPGQAVAAFAGHILGQTAAPRSAGDDIGGHAVIAAVHHAEGHGVQKGIVRVVCVQRPVAVGRHVCRGNGVVREHRGRIRAVDAPRAGHCVHDDRAFGLVIRKGHLRGVRGHGAGIEIRRADRVGPDLHAVGQAHRKAVVRRNGDGQQAQQEHGGEGEGHQLLHRLLHFACTPSVSPAPLGADPETQNIFCL